MTNKSNIETNILDAVIVGAGAAGLAAALFLVRSRRSVIIYDSGDMRISKAPKIHAFLGFEGITPTEFKKQSIEEIKKFGGEIKKEKVLKIEPIAENAFKVYTTEGTVISKTVIIATGMIDVLPKIPGLTEGWGKDIHVCPCFTGYELKDKKILVFGLDERIGQLAKFTTAWAKNITVVSKHNFEPVVLKKLELAGVKIIKDEIITLIRDKGKLIGATTQENKEISCDEVFIAIPMKAASYLAKSLCDVDDFGFAKTDANGKTSRDGVWAIGNANDPAAHMAHASAAGSRVGPMVTDYIVEQMLSKLMV